MFGDWYARNMYIQGSPQNLYHVRHYGHPSKFGYKDICALWKAENFDPDELMDLYYRAGARYFVAQAMHHDNFFNYDSKIHPLQLREHRPRQGYLCPVKAAADKHNMPFGLTEHLGASFSWWTTNKGSDSYGPYKGVPYDGNDPPSTPSCTTPTRSTWTPPSTAALSSPGSPPTRSSRPSGSAS